MDYGIYLSTAGAMVQELKADQVANNLANSNSTGFRRVLQSIQERQAESREDPSDRSWGNETLDGIGGGVFLARTMYTKQAGPILVTDGPYDFAIQGSSGWFAVRSKATDEVLYTKAGDFRVDEKGVLVTADGEFDVLDTSGNSIQVGDPGENLGRKLQVRSFPEDARMLARGGSRYKIEGAGTPIEAPGLVVSGAVEQSSVEAVREMVDLIKVLRAYEANAQAIREQNDTLARAVNEIARSPR